MRVLQGVFTLVFWFAGPGLLLALPVLYRDRNARSFFCAWLLAALGIGLPLLGFFGASLFVPDWKGACRFGWVDCFHQGKLMLLPLTLWAMAAFYALQVWRVQNPHRRWIVLGMFMGAVISTVCLVHGAVTLGRWREMKHPGFWVAALVPFCSALWYSLLSARLMRAARERAAAYALTLAGSVPFWAASIWMSRRIFTGLPDVPPDCFVVTAAARGHSAVAGPYAVDGASRQLVIFRALEHHWSVALPRSHRLFRAGYNRIGPHIARRARSPWAADVVCLALKPLEWAAAVVLARAVVQPLDDAASPPSKDWMNGTSAPASERPAP